MSGTSSPTARSRGSTKTASSERATSIAAVTAGFGPFVARGGFAVDVHAFKQAGLTDQQVRVRVLGLGALEYALLAPAACVVAIQLLADGHSPSLALTLPWAIAVPLGFVAALWAVEKRDTLRAHAGRRRHLADALDSIHVLKTLLQDAATCSARSAPPSTGSATSSASGPACRHSRTARPTSRSCCSATRPATR